jgi:hypothetical protein
MLCNRIQRDFPLPGDGIEYQDWVAAQEMQQAKHGLFASFATQKRRA